MKRRDFLPHAGATVTVILIIAIAVMTLTGCIFDGIGGAPIPTVDAEADAEALSDADIAFATDDTVDAVAGDFTLPITGEVNTTTTITWVSGNTDVISIDNTSGTATVSRPADADADVPLTATLTGGDGRRSTKTVTVTVLATTDAGNDAAALGTGDITFTSGDSATAVTGDFTLPTTGEVNGSTITWESGNTVVITIDNTTGTATVTRPADDNAEVSLTATITDTDSKTSTKTITVTVVAEGGDDGGDGGGDSGGGTSATGTLDTSFGGTGIVTHDNAAGGSDSDVGNQILIDSDGKIVVVGGSFNSAGNWDMAIWRYDTDGTLDDTFGGDGIVTYHNAAGGDGYDKGTSVALDADGKILVAGESDTGTTNSWDIVIWRYKSDGTLDTTFGGGDGFVTHNNAAGGNGSDRAQSIVVDSAGRILVAGTSNNSSDNIDMAIWRYNSDGNLDTTFGGGDGIVTHHNAAGGDDNDNGLSIAIDSNDRILVAGSSYSASNNYDMTIWRYNGDGNLDTSFGSGGFVTHNSAAGGDNGDEGTSIALDSDGRILITGYSLNSSNNDDMAIWRYDINGNLDTSFGSGGFVTHGSAAGGDDRDKGASITLDSDGRILVAGESYNSMDTDMALWRYNSDGSLDTTFGTDGIITHNNAAGGDSFDGGTSVVLDSNGKILVAGGSRNSSGNGDMVIWRYE